MVAGNGRDPSWCCAGVRGGQFCNGNAGWDGEGCAVDGETSPVAHCTRVHGVCCPGRLHTEHVGVWRSGWDVPGPTCRGPDDVDADAGEATKAPLRGPPATSGNFASGCQGVKQSNRWPRPTSVCSTGASAAVGRNRTTGTHGASGEVGVAVISDRGSCELSGLALWRAIRIRHCCWRQPSLWLFITAIKTGRHMHRGASHKYHPPPPLYKLRQCTELLRSLRRL